MKPRFIAAALLLMALGGAGSPLLAQSYCTTPGTPPAPPPPPPTPPYCTPKDCNKCTKSPCYVATGGYTNDFEDLSIRTNSFPISAFRHYESIRMVDGPLGIGWTFSLTPRLYYAVYLISAPNTTTREVEVLMTDGSLIRFSESGGTFVPYNGRSDTLVHNGDGTWDLTPQKTVMTLHFNADGSLARMSDRYANSLSYTYDGNGRVASVQDGASSRSVTVTWGGNGRVASLTDSTGRTVSYGYDTNGALTTVTNALQQTTTMTYVNGRFAPLLASIRDHWGRTITELTWQSDDKLHSYTEGTYTGAGSTGEKYTYSYSPGSTNKTDSFGTHTYYPDASSGLVNGDPNNYDGYGRVVTEPNSVSYSYDSQNRIDWMFKGAFWKYTYDANFPTQVASVIAYNDSSATNPNRDYAGYYFTYVPPGQNGAGSLLEMQQLRSDGSTRDVIMHVGYDAQGRVTSMVDLNNITSTFAYNAAGDLITVANPAGSTTYGYDALGRVTSVTDPLGKVTTYAYDNLDRMTSITLPKPSTSSTLTFTTTYSYDNWDTVSGLTFLNVTDQNGRITQQGFDALGNLVKEIDSGNYATTYTYRYNLLDSVVDPNGATTHLGYDGNRQRNTTTFPDGTTESIYASADGTFYGKTDRRGTGVGYSYDVWGRVTSIYWTRNGSTIENISNTYVGQKLTSTTYSRGTFSDTISYTYDTAYRLATETQGNRAKIQYTHLLGASDLINTFVVGPVSGSGPTSTVIYGYDAAGRANSIYWSRFGGSFTLAYNAVGQLTSVTMPNGAHRTYTYDDQTRITSVSNTDQWNGLLAYFGYTYDHDWATNTDTMKGQLTSVTATGNVPYLRLGETKYTYDARYQLVRADFPNQNYPEMWTYDPAGSIASHTLGYTTPYTYYSDASGHALPRLRNDGQLPYDFMYDANGNFLGYAGSANAQWDAQNRLLSMDGNYNEAYDSLGRRITGKTSTNTTSYVYHGILPVSERNTTPAPSGSQNDYLFAPGLDRPLAVSPAQDSGSYYIVDGLGSVIANLQTDGTVTGGTQYYPYGLANGNAPALFGFTGRESSGTGYVYYRSRHYDPQHGRFLSEDPLSQAALIVGGQLYNYASNSPAMYTDPMGLAPCTWRITHGIWMKLYDDWSQEWRIKNAWTDQVVQPPFTQIIGRKPKLIPTVKMIMTCVWHRYLQITTHLRRKVRLIVYCDCPQNASNFTYDEDSTDYHEYDTGHQITQSSWSIALPMKPCPHP